MSAALGLGTAQLGLEGYGITGPGGLPSRADALALIARATPPLFRTIDTAPHYGGAEALVGEARGGDRVEVVTRTPAFLTQLGPTEAARRVRSGLARSLELLRADRVHGLLVHVVDDLLGPCGDALFGELVRAKESGLVARIGSVAYTGEQLDLLLDRYDLELVQVPLSVFDQRLVKSGHLGRLAERGIEVHVRSVFLQGLLLLEPGDLARRADMEHARVPLERFREVAATHGWTPLEAALGFALATEGVDVVTVGVHAPGELDEIERAATRGARAESFAELASDDLRLIDPTTWPNAR